MIVNIVLAAFFLAIAIIRKQKLLSPVFLFNAIWLAIFFLYTLGSFIFYAISEITVVVLGVMVLAFNLGIFLADFMPRFKLETKIVLPLNLKKIIFITLYIMAILGLLRNSIVVIQQLLSGKSFWDILSSEGLATGETGIWVFITYFAVKPMVYFLTPLAIYGFLFNKDLKLLIADIIVVALYTLDHGGRVGIFYFLVCFVVIYVMSRINANIPKKMGEFKISKKTIGVVVIVAACLFFIFAITASRGINDQLKSWYSYLCGCIPYLDQRLGIANESLYGAASSWGILNPLFTLLRGVKIIPDFPEWFTSAREALTTQEIINIGPDVRFNAFCTPAYYYYLDAGIIGVIIGMCAYGLFSQLSYRKLRSTPTAKAMCIYALIAFSIIFSMERQWFSSYPYLFAYFYTLFFVDDYEKHFLAEDGMVSIKMQLKK